MAESRVKKSLLNAKVNLIFYMLTLALSFFSRKIFLNCLGADFVGLTGTLQNLLGFLNLAELGIGSAIGYVLYKPLFTNNKTKINEIISVLGYLYQKIGLLIMGLGCLLACFFPLIFPKTGLDFGVIYAVYFGFLASSLIGYFCNYKQTLLGADQKNYIITAYFQTAQLIKTIVQIVSVWYIGSYYLWIIVEVIFGVIYSLILNWKIHQTYPWLLCEIRQGAHLFSRYTDVIKYTKQLFVHNLGVFVQMQTTPFLIYSFASLQMVAYFGNYTLITDKISIFINNILGSTSAGIGNLIAEGNQKKIQLVFWELFSLRMLLAGIICFALYKLTGPFIQLWLGESYVLDNSILILIIINIFIRITRGATDQFIYGYGLFWDVWAPVTESFLNIVVAVSGGYFFGLPGILMGGIVSLALIVGMWKPFFLYHWGFKKSVIEYWKQFILYLINLALAGSFSLFILSKLSIYPEESYLAWCAYACILIITFGLSVTILMCCTIPSVKFLIIRILNIIKNRSSWHNGTSC